MTRKSNGVKIKHAYEHQGSPFQYVTVDKYDREIGLEQKPTWTLKEALEMSQARLVRRLIEKSKQPRKP